jgi:hypothetical protein
LKVLGQFFACTRHRKAKAGTASKRRSDPHHTAKISDQKLLGENALFQTRATVEQQMKLAVARGGDRHTVDVAHFLLVGHGGDRALGRLQHAEGDLGALRQDRAFPAARAEGLIGVKASIWLPSGRIGPLADRLYAVDPAGVATRMPSQARSAMRTLSFTVISSRAVWRVSRSSETSLMA